MATIQETNRVNILPLEYQIDGSNLTTAVNLTVVVGSRETCGLRQNGEGLIVDSFSSENGTISFVNGKNGLLTTDFTDDKQANPECLGIKSIQVKYTSEFYPQVQIIFIDVRGKGLIESNEGEFQNNLKNESFFKYLYYVPSPIFKLTLKGFYGKQTTYELAVRKTNLSFDSETGYFEITVDFMGYMYGIYNDLSSYLVFGSGFCDLGKKYWDSQVNSGRFVFDDSFPMHNPKRLISDIAKVSENNSLGDDFKDGISKNITKRDFLRSILNSASFLEEWDFVKEENFIYTVKQNSDLHTFLIKKFTTLYSFSDKYYSNYGNDDVYRILRKMVDPSFKIGINILLPDSDGVLGSEGLSDATMNLIQENSSIHLGSKKMVLYRFNCDEDLTALIGILKRKIKEENDNIDKLIEEYKKAYIEDIQSRIGFKPSIKNVFKYVFANMETFMHTFYKLLDDINSDIVGNRRKMADFEISSDNTDTKKDFFLPFTSVYTDLSDTKQEIWIGNLKDKNGNRLREADFVEEMVKGITLSRDNERPILNEGIMINVYNILKTLYERWLCMGDKYSWIINKKDTRLYEVGLNDFDNFSFIDNYCHNIGDNIVVDVEKLSWLLSQTVSSCFVPERLLSVYSFLNKIAENVHGSLIGFPVSINITDKNSLSEIFKPHKFIDSNTDTHFSCVFIYSYEIGQHIMNSDEYNENGIVITDDNGKLQLNTPSFIDNVSEDSKIFAFTVDYGVPEQNIFNNFSITMENPSTTEVGITGIYNVLKKNGVSPKEPLIYGQNIFNIFSNYSFGIEIEMAGNMQIIPLMYFELRGIPLWNGLYMIRSVEHSFSIGNSITKIKAFRVNKNCIGFTDGFAENI